MANAWDPTQYERFRAERLQPALDLIGLVEPRPRMRAIDLGCGTGEPTLRLAERLPPDARIEGIDTSEAMLAKAAPRSSERITFRLGDAAQVANLESSDLIFSNAALQWVPDHEALFGRWLATLKAGAQVAIQMPYNHSHASHRVAEEVATSAPFSTWLGGFVQRHATLPLERYAALFFEHGFERSALFEKVYSHRLGSAGDVVEWVKGTLLIAYLERLEGERQAEFLEAYRVRLRAEIGGGAPYLYTYRRMFLWAEKAVR